jgi:hypothetical protein
MNFFKKIFRKTENKQLEDYFEVTITETFLMVSHSRIETKQIFWKEINEIKLINNNSGPFVTDIWMSLLGENSSCLIPHGSLGFDKVYDIVSKYKNFDFDNVTKSMRCVDNQEFLLWKRINF